MNWIRTPYAKAVEETKAICDLEEVGGGRI